MKNTDFIVPNIVLTKHRKKEITCSAAVLYTEYCRLWHDQNRPEKIYLSTPALMSYAHMKRSTLFYANKQLIKAGLIVKDKRKHIKLKHLVEVYRGL